MKKTISVLSLFFISFAGYAQMQVKTDQGTILMYINGQGQIGINGEPDTGKTLHIRKPAGATEFGIRLDPEAGFISTGNYWEIFHDDELVFRNGMLESLYPEMTIEDPHPHLSISRDPSNKIGIGVQTPMANLHIRSWSEYGMDTTIRLDGGKNWILGAHLTDFIVPGQTNHGRFYIQRADGDEYMVINPNGKIGFGVQDPKAGVQIGNGDLYEEGSVNGVVLQSPNGSCFRITVGDDGSLTTEQIACP